MGGHRAAMAHWGERCRCRATLGRLRNHGYPSVQQKMYYTSSCVKEGHNTNYAQGDENNRTTTKIAVSLDNLDLEARHWADHQWCIIENKFPYVILSLSCCGIIVPQGGKQVQHWCM